MDNPVMGAGDFSYVLGKVPGAMFWLGASEAGSDWALVLRAPPRTIWYSTRA